MYSNRRNAFTLLELMLAIAIGVIVLAMAVPSLSSLLAERQLRESFDLFNEFAQRGQENAVSQQRSWVMIWLPEEVVLQPDNPTSEELMAGRESATLKLPISEGEVYKMERPAALTKDAPMEWTFWRSGVCEPVLVHYSGPGGKWTARYDALSGNGEIIAQTLP